MPSPEEVMNMIKEAGGKIESMGSLPDGSGFATASFPLRKDHWLYEDKWNIPPMPFRCGSMETATLHVEQSNGPQVDYRFEIMSRDRLAEYIREAGRYAYRCATMNGKESDIDPDALLQNLVVGMIGYWTDNGYSDDESENPKPKAVCPPPENPNEVR